MRRAMTANERAVEELCRKVEREWSEERARKLRAYAAGLGGDTRKLSLDEVATQVQGQPKVPPGKALGRRVQIDVLARTLTKPFTGRINRDSETVRSFLVDGVGERVIHGGTDGEFSAALKEAEERAVREFRGF